MSAKMVAVLCACATPVLSATPNNTKRKLVKRLDGLFMVSPEESVRKNWN
jgi:hypothetical protein